MKTNQLLTNVLAPVMFAGIMLFGTSAFAQVKIGTNPTTIDAANNLEVESVAGNKVSVNKTTGKVTISDGSQATGNVFTSDVNGVGSWLPNIPTAVIANTTSNTVVAGGTFKTVIFQNASLNRGGNYNVSTGLFTASSTGIYLVSASITFPPISVASQLNVSLFKNNVREETLYQNGNATSGTFYLGSGSMMILLNAGDVLDIRANTNVTNVVTGSCSILKLSN